MGGATDGVTPAISLSGVSRVYRTSTGERIEAVRNVSLGVERGEFAAVVGPSGCGKSTLLRMIAGLDPPTAGTVRVNGHPVTRPIADVGIVFQDPLLMAWRRTLENVMLPAEMLGLERRAARARARALLALVGLDGVERRYQHELSGGQQQRVAIARALIHDPPLLLMDEPFGALDEITREQMGFELLRIWEETGKTVWFVTHSIPEAVLLADRVLVMSPRPGVVREELTIALPRPRPGKVRASPEYVNACERIRESLGLGS